MSHKISVELSHSTCNHDTLILESSGYVSKVDYTRPAEQQRAAATTAQGRINSNPKGKRKRGVENAPEFLLSELFPAPLVLPGDDLALDPQYPSQSLRSWVREKERNKVTSERNTVYVAASPEVGADVNFIRAWSEVQQQDNENHPPYPTQPQVQDVVDYLSAFYYGLPVKKLSAKLHFTSWDDGHSKTKKAKTRASTPNFIGLNTSLECVRIRTRPSRDDIFPRQLNLDDLLDAAISVLPDDAYALLMLVQHDLFEEEDDLFVCGRAYGGSRVAVISTARYNPELDSVQDVERDHAWPASHCEEYLQERCASTSKQIGRPKKKTKTSAAASDKHNSSFSISMDGITISPLQAAVSAHRALPSLIEAPSTAALSGLWLGRVCRTSSHELGHCFGMDHCVYYACSMQGSASLTEDARQPPYLCPVDLAKMLRATGADAGDRLEALLAFCGHRDHEDVHLFKAFAAWIRCRLAIMKNLD
ncbi:MAG: hypothetical protein M1834_000529 [Cirrosporium novae-zelandiae]|nr:MAG: hypothetical protein M1834_000529 [Cirrosporium novae-zelandiae]